MKYNKSPRITDDELIIPLIDYVENVTYSVEILTEDFIGLLQKSDFDKTK